jgi:hypothetical protein
VLDVPKQVDDNDEDEEDGDVGIVVDCVAAVPVLDGKGGSNDFQGKDDEPLQGVAEKVSQVRAKGGGVDYSLPAHCKAPCGINEASRVC